MFICRYIFVWRKWNVEWDKTDFGFFWVQMFLSIHCHVLSWPLLSLLHNFHFLLFYIIFKTLLVPKVLKYWKNWKQISSTNFQKPSAEFLMPTTGFHFPKTEFRCRFSHIENGFNISFNVKFPTNWYVFICRYWYYFGVL